MENCIKLRSRNVFYGVLITGSQEEVIKTLEVLKRGEEGIEDQIFDMLMYMPNGGITLEEAWTMSAWQRDKIIKKINKYNEERHGSTEDDYIVQQGKAPDE